MDEYLQCLYNDILEVRRDETLLKTPEYRTHRTAMLFAMRLIEDSLSEEQQKAFDRYLTCYSNLSILESDWLFHEGVALGKWLAQP